MKQTKSIYDEYKDKTNKDNKRIVLFHDTRKEAVFEENGRKYKAENKEGKTVTGLQIDDGVIPSEDVKKCDKALLVNEEKLYLIELKGADLNTACKQLLSTYEILKPKYEKYEYLCRVVLSKASEKHSALENNPTSSLRKLHAKLDYKNHNDRFQRRNILFPDSI